MGTNSKNMAIRDTKQHSTGSFSVVWKFLSLVGTDLRTNRRIQSEESTCSRLEVGCIMWLWRKKGACVLCRLSAGYSLKDAPDFAVFNPNRFQMDYFRLVSLCHNAIVALCKDIVALHKAVVALCKAIVTWCKARITSWIRWTFVWQDFYL